MTVWTVAAEGTEKLGRVRFRVALPAALLCIGLLIGQVTERLASLAQSPYPLTATLSWNAWKTAPPAARRLLATDALTDDPELPVSFESGETLSDVLAAHGLGPREIHAVVSEIGRFTDLRRLRPTDHYAASFDGEAGLEKFDLLLASRGRIRVERKGDDWRSSWRAFEKTIKTTMIEGRLDHSLEAAIEAAGGPTTLSILMSDVFQWDLDFTRDLRRGDTFKVLFDTVFLDGVYDSINGIVAITYDNGGKRLEAYRFGSDGQYFDPEGRPMRKMFLRSPLRYSRVTSRFSNRRFHPILKRYRPHHGVDYGAPTGTPVRVTANGKVTFAGWDRGGGKTVKVRHPNGYLTAYLHLSRFASGVRSGRRVSQGDVIGYVGSTGLSTAPHLDYRVQRNGRWIDPLSLRSVPADPVPMERQAEFFALRDGLREVLSGGPEAPGRLAMTVARLGDTGISAQATPAGGSR